MMQVENLFRLQFRQCEPHSEAIYLNNHSITVI